jgi:hypothetical protein
MPFIQVLLLVCREQNAGNSVTSFDLFREECLKIVLLFWSLAFTVTQIQFLPLVCREAECLKFSFFLWSLPRRMPQIQFLLLVSRVQSAYNSLYSFDRSGEECRKFRFSFDLWQAEFRKTCYNAEWNINARAMQYCNTDSFYLFIYLMTHSYFIYGSFNDDVSNSDSIALNDRIIGD